MKKRNKFALSHTVLASFDAGELIPIGAMEVLPGDTVQHASSALLRASPLLSPVYHPVHVRIHHFFVPNRLIWEDWEDFITGGPDGNNAAVYPTITIGGGSGAAVGSLADYLGVPTGVNNIEFSALFHRAYALIFNEYYRDQDLQTKLTIDLTSGADTTTSLTLQNCGWEKDYFTSARPWEQKGPAITIPVGDTAPVTRVSNAANGWRAYRAGGNVVEANTELNTDAQADLTNSASNQDLTFDPRGGLVADLSSAAAISISDLREAFALQRFEEARARFGSRYTEYLAYLGVRSSDARLQRPEYLGGGKQTIQFSEVLATAETGTSVDVGDLKGHGIAAMRSNRYRKFFEEHGIVMSLMSVRPKTMYPQGLFRHFNRRTKEDFWQSELEAIGQQEVKKKEVYAGTANTPTDVFGYQDRYDEYRRFESRVSGEFRTVLDFWHFARIFGSEPALNADFVKCVPSEEPFAVPSTDVYYAHIKHSIQARRLVAKTGKSFIF